jgi:PIN domain nuclease of toxin-antitoxin system
MTFLSIVPLMVILLVVVLRWIRIDSEKLLSKVRDSIDISGTLALISIVSTFLVGLTLLPHSISDPNNSNLFLTLSLLMISVALLPIFFFT